MKKTNTNYLIANSQAICGYIDESTPCGRAKAKQVKADLEQLAIMLEDSNLTDQTKRAVKLDYIKAMSEYIEREEECSDCTNEECDYYEEEEIVDVKDMAVYYIRVNDTTYEYELTDYQDVINTIRALEQLEIDYDIYAYDSENNEYECETIRERGNYSLEIVE